MHTLSAILVLWKKLELGVIAGGGSPVGVMCFLLDFDAKCVNDTGVFNWTFFTDIVEGFGRWWLSVTNLELQTKRSPEVKFPHKRDDGDPVRYTTTQ
jgi:hypothetical protein